MAVKQTKRANAQTVGDVFSEVGRAPRRRLPENEMDPEVAYQIVHDELMLDGNARLNLATFVGTWMEPQAQRLMAETFDKNMINKDEYPQTAEMEMRCVDMISRLWHAPDPDDSPGCSTTGSSEAAMLGGLALKRRWQDARRAAGKPIDRPNIVMGINVQVCWEKFARYWDVEPRTVPMEGDRYHIDPAEAAALCDENTIGVIGILGSTYDGSYEPIEASTSRCTSTRRPADSWPRSWTRISTGTSASTVSCPSTPRATSTASWRPVLAGSSGARSSTCRKS